MYDAATYLNGQANTLAGHFLDNQSGKSYNGAEPTVHAMQDPSNATSKLSTLDSKLPETAPCRTQRTHPLQIGTTAAAWLDEAF